MVVASQTNYGASPAEDSLLETQFLPEEEREEAFGLPLQDAERAFRHALLP